MIDLLIVSPSSSNIYQDLKNEYSAIETPIWAGLLANCILSINRGVAIIDLEAEKISNEDFVKKVEELDPKFVLFVVTGQNPSASTPAMQGAIENAEFLKTNSAKYKIGFVGPHINALPLETMQKHDFIDVVFCNEGVFALKKLVQTNLRDYELCDINGIGYRDDGGDIKLNPPERVVPQDSLELELPGPSYEMMPDLSKYRTSYWHCNYSGETSPFASIYTSLGCSFTCNFCMINIINRDKNGSDKYAGMFNKFRYWNPEFTIKQLDLLNSLGVKNIKIADELFLNNPKKHAMPLCDLIIDRGYDFNIWAYTRVNTVKESHLEKLKKAGVNWLAIGIENIKQSVRQEVDKGKFKDVNITSVVKMIESFDINVIQNYIVGLPGESIKDAEDNINFAIDLNCAAYNVHPAMALPGSQLYTDAVINKKRLPENYSEFGFSSYDCIPLSNGIMTEEEILEIRDENWNKYYTNNSVLDMVKTRFGKNAKDNIIQMSQIKVRRKLLEGG